MAYINGSDLLLMVGTKCVGHCSTHSVTFSAETKERAVKPLQSVTSATTGLWPDKTITGLSASVSAEGYCYTDETENGYDEMLELMLNAQPVDVKGYKRGEETPYFSGKFVITNLEKTGAAKEDATYKLSAESCGEVKTAEATA